MRFVAEAPIAKVSVAWRMILASLLLLLVAGFTMSRHLLNIEMSLAVLAASAYGLFQMSRAPTLPGKKPRAIVADATGLFIDGACVLDHASIVRAYAVERAPRLHAVHVETRYPWRKSVVFVESGKKSRALIDALQVSVSSSTARFRALPPWARHLRWLAVVLTASPLTFVNSLRLLPGWGIAAIVALYAILLVPALLPQRVDVGQDGIFLRWLGNKRFIPFSAIGQITTTKIGVELFLITGRHHEIRLTQRDNAADGQLSALVARIEEGMAAHKGRTRADEETLLTRGGRDVETWLREMRALGTAEGGGYRKMAIARERLWDIVENPSADPSAREGAAFALSSALDDDDRARLAALSLRTASPRLRIALAGVSRETEEAHLRVALETAERELENDDPASAPAAAQLRAR